MARLLAGLSLLLCLGGVDASAQSPVTWSVTVGFENLYRENAWTPLTVEISNTGPNLRGELFVPISADDGVNRPDPLPTSVNYTIPLDLPSQSRKQYTLCVPSCSLDAVYFRLGQRPIKHDLKGITALESNAVFAVVVGGDGNALRALNGLALPTVVAGSKKSSRSDSSLRVGHVPWSGLPDNWLAWDGVDVVVLADANVSTAAVGGVEALRQWVQQGGTLFVPGGAVAPALSGSPLEPLLPLQAEGTEAVPAVNELVKWCGANSPLPPGGVLLTRGSLRPKADVVAGNAARPLVVQWAVGQGRVVLPLFDYTGQPFKYWSGQERLWGQLLGLCPVCLNGQELWNQISTSLCQLAGYVPENTLPSLAVLISFLVVYLLALAPGQYLLLRKLDKRELAWIVTPAIVLMFTFGAYGITLHTRGSDTILQRLAVIRADAGATVGRGKAGVGLFSPRATRYEWALGKSVSGVRMSKSQGSGQVTIAGGPQPAIRNFGVEMWSSRSFNVECLADLGRGVQVPEAEWNGSRLLVKVANGSRLDFKETMIVRPNSMQSLGRLRPGGAVGGSIAFVPVISPSNAKPGTPEYLGSLLLQQMGYGPGPISVPGATGPYSSLPPPHYLSHSLPQFAGVCFVGITYDKVLPVDLQHLKARENDVTLVVVPIQVQLKAHASVQIPPWMTSATVLSTTRQSSPSNSHDLRLRFSFDCASPDFKFVKLTLLAENEPGNSRVTQLKLLNQKTGQWDALQETSRCRWPVPNPQQYTDAAGNVMAACSVRDWRNLQSSPMQAEATVVTP